MPDEMKKEPEKFHSIKMFGRVIPQHINPTWADYMEAKVLALASRPSEKEGERCDACAGKMVSIRGRYPRDPKRAICPTCAQEQLEDLRSLKGQGSAVPPPPKGEK